MSVRVEHDAENNSYSLGDDIDGVFIPFATLDGAAVKGRVDAVAAATTTAATATAPAPAKVTGNTGDDFDPADFTDNGDGSFTRTSDGIQGRFTPAGFQPITAP